MVKLEPVPRVIWQVENGYKIKNKKININLGYYIYLYEYFCRESCFSNGQGSERRH
jgi:hypothetical protein